MMSLKQGLLGTCSKSLFRAKISASLQNQGKSFLLCKILRKNSKFIPTQKVQTVPNLSLHTNRGKEFQEVR